MIGLLEQEVKHLQNVKVHSPNIRAQWVAEENERSFIEWCRRAPDGKGSPVEIPDGKPLTRLTAYIFIRSVLP